MRNNCPDSSKFCDACGTAFAAQQPNQQPNQQDGQQPNQQQNYYYNNYQNNGQPNGYQQPPYQQNSYQPNGYQQNPYQPNGPQGGNYRVPIKNWNIALCIVLSIITCGIYGIYWMYKASEKVAYVKQRNTGEVDSSSSVLYLILGIVGFGIVAYALIQSELNKVATLQ